MSVVLGRLADVAGHVMQVEHQLVEIRRNAGQLGDDVAGGEGMPSDSALPYLSRDPAEMIDVGPHAPGDQPGEEEPHEVDERRDADLARLPIGSAYGRVKEFRSGMRRDERPASPPALDGDDRGENLLAAIGSGVADLQGRVPGAGVRELRSEE